MSLGIGIIWHWTSKSIAIIALTLTLLVIPYIYDYKNVDKLETSLRHRHSPSSQVVWYTHANNLSSTKSTVTVKSKLLTLLNTNTSSSSTDFLQENLVSGPHHCGRYKCLFPLKTDPQIGYLVEQRGSDAEAEAISNAFTASENIIKEKYGMDHIYLAPPKIMSASLDFRKWMEVDMTNHLPGRFTKQPEVVVQAVAIVPEEDSIILGVTGPRRQHGLKGIEKMFTPKNNESWNITDVEIAVKRDFELLYRLVEDEKDDKLPCLCHDFQIFLLRSGHLIHLDVDRCFKSPDWMRRRCVPELQELETLVLNRLQKSRLEQKQQRMGVISNSSLPPTHESMVARP